MTTTLAPFAPTAADMEAVYFGIAVSSVGEDGDLIALGHHEPRRVLAALNRHCRTFFGWDNVADDRHAEAAPVLADIQPRWAVFAPPNPEDGEDPECPWYCHWMAGEDTPGAVPIMLLRALAF